MKNITLFKTKSNGTYFHSESNNQFLFTHPVFFHLLRLHKQGKDLRDWMESIQTDTVEIQDCGSVSKKDLEYYYEKYLLLAENGYFNSVDLVHQLSGRYTAHDMKSFLANTGHITFEVTDSCNLKCDYCTYGKFYNNYDKREGSNLSIKKARNLLDYLQVLFSSPLNKCHGRNVRIGFYGGEPLMNFGFIEEIVDYANRLTSQPNSFSFGMTTNAVLLDRYMDFLVKHDFQLMISLDGDESNNAYRVFPNGKPAFHKIYENILKLREKYPVFFKKNINFNSILHSKNSISEIHGYFKKEFDKIPNIGEINVNGIAPEMREEFLGAFKSFFDSFDQAENRSQIEKDLPGQLPLLKNTSATLLQYSGYVYDRYNSILSSNENQQYIPTGTCLPMSKKIFVLSNGKIFPCERIGHQFAFGYVDEDQVVLDFEKLAEQMNRYYDSIRDRCSVCRIYRNCNQCIFYIDVDKEKPKCNYFMNEKKFTEFLSTHMSYLEEHPDMYVKTMNKEYLQ